MLIDVAAEEDVVPGKPWVCQVGGREILIVRWGDELFAMRNICPHQSLPLDTGRVHSSVRCANPFAEIEVLSDEPLISCPMHAWDFELRTGRCLVDPGVRVRTYETVVKDGRVFIDDGRKQRMPAPTVAQSAEI